MSIASLADRHEHDDGHVAAGYRRHLGSGRASMCDLFGGYIEVESNGSWVVTSDGRRYLNVGGYGVFITGARHPAVIAEVQRQLQRHPVATRMFFEPSVARAADALMGVAPDGLARVHFSGSGAEAVETGIKLARARGHNHLVSMNDGFHGKTMGALSVTAKSVFQDPFRPLLPSVDHVPFGQTAALTEVLAAHPGQACVIVEPVQGEAGVVIPPAGYLREVADVCRQYDALLILDEIQTGLGRLGSWWGADRDGVTPDILLAGKGLGGGVLPVAATIATAETFGVFERDPFLHTSTFSGSPLAMAAAYGAIKALKDDDLIERAAAIGQQLIPELTRIIDHHFAGLAHEVRGAGLLIGIDIAEPGLAGELLLSLIEHSIIANHSLNADRVVRLTPPAVLSDADITFLLDGFDKAAYETANRFQPSKG